METHKTHVHFLDSAGHGDTPEQLCVAVHSLKPGGTVQMHFHDGPCRRCPEGHCHAPNVTLAMTDDGAELMVTFENMAVPLYVEGADRGEAPHDITRATRKLVTGEGEIDYARAS